MIRMNRIINVQTEKGKTKLKIRKQNGQMIIFLKGRIDTNNAPQVDEKIFAALEGESYNEENIMIEAEDLEYISSAGLRVLMKLRKTIGKPLTIFNVNRDVYEIFDTTGFTELFNIKKALRSVSIEGCEEIGKGGHGKVYRLDPETIIKVYHDNSPLSLIEKEREYAKNYVDKLVSVKNVGASDAYVRLYVAFPSELDNDDASKNIIHWNFGNYNDNGTIKTTYGNKWNWLKADGSWNYSKKTIDGVEYNVYIADYKDTLAEDATTEYAINGFYLDKKVDYTDGAYTINGNAINFDFSHGVKVLVKAVAVQSAGFNNADEAVVAAFGADFDPFAE